MKVREMSKILREHSYLGDCEVTLKIDDKQYPLDTSQFYIEIVNDGETSTSTLVINVDKVIKQKG